MGNFAEIVSDDLLLELYKPMTALFSVLMDCCLSAVPGGIAPDSLTFTPLDDMIFLKWEEPVEPNGLITQYEVGIKSSLVYMEDVCGGLGVGVFVCVCVFVCMYGVCVCFCVLDT